MMPLVKRVSRAYTLTSSRSPADVDVDIDAVMAGILSNGVPNNAGQNVVAFSGGVDSSTAAFLVHRAFPKNTSACIGISAALPTVQLELARRVSDFIGIPLLEIPTGWFGALTTT